MSAIEPVYTPYRLEWDDFVDTWPWNQGEHVAIIGPTGSGKSVLMYSLMQLRQWVITFGTKKKDYTYDEYLSHGYRRFFEWPPPKPRRHQMQQHLLLWPKIKTIDDLYDKGPIFQKAMEQVFIDEGWTLGLDDLYYLAHILKLNRTVSALNYQVRSMGVTLVSAMQRPAWVPISAWDQSSHVFISKLSNVDDLSTIRGLGKNLSTRELSRWLNEMVGHEWLYLPVRGDDYDPVIVEPPLP